MELRRRTWFAALRLAVVGSAIAAGLAILLSTVGDVPDAAILLPVVVAAFVASWIQTGRVRRSGGAPVMIIGGRHVRPISHVRSSIHPTSGSGFHVA